MTPHTTQAAAQPQPWNFSSKSDRNEIIDVIADEVLWIVLFLKYLSWEEVLIYRQVLIP